MSVWGLGQGYQAPNLPPMGGGGASPMTGRTGPSMWQTGDPAQYNRAVLPNLQMDYSNGFVPEMLSDPFARAVATRYGAPAPNLPGNPTGRTQELAPQEFGGGRIWDLNAKKLTDQWFGKNGVGGLTDEQMFSLDRQYDKLKGTFSLANQYYADALNAGSIPGMNMNRLRQDQSMMQDAFRAYEERASRLGIL